MEFKGTKSKWYLTGVNKTFVYALNEKQRNSFSLLLNNDGNIPIEELQANALLISKAPELLDHLKNLVSDMSELISELEDRGYEWQQAGYYNSSKNLLREFLKS